MHSLERELSNYLPAMHMSSLMQGTRSTRMVFDMIGRCLTTSYQSFRSIPNISRGMSAFGQLAEKYDIISDVCQRDPFLKQSHNNDNSLASFPYAFYDDAYDLSPGTIEKCWGKECAPSVLLWLPKCFGNLTQSILPNLQNMRLVSANGSKKPERLCSGFWSRSPETSSNFFMSTNRH